MKKMSMSFSQPFLLLHNPVRATGVLLVLVAAAILANMFASPGVGRAMNAVLWLLAASMHLLTADNADSSHQRSTFFASLALAAYTIFFLVKVLYQNIVTPQEWDFLAKYIEAGMALNGLNFYQPESYELALKRLTVPIEPSATFREEIFEVGFKYFPPFIFILAPIGYFSYPIAQLVWFLIHFAFLLASSFLIAACVGRRTRRNLQGFLFAFSYIGLFPPTGDVFHYGQTHLIILFLALAVLYDLQRDRAGIWIALSSFVKPFGALFGLVFLLKRRWTAIGVGLLAGIIGLAVTGIVFGFDIIQSFLFENPTRNVPAWQYTQRINQSIPATVLRFLGATGTNSHPLLNPYVLVSVGVLSIITCFLVLQVEKDGLEWGFALTVVWAILIYPGSLTHYSIYLLLPMMLVLTRNDYMGGSKIAKIGSLAIVLLLLRLDNTLAYLVCWLAVGTMTFRHIGGKRCLGKRLSNGI